MVNANYEEKFPKKGITFDDVLLIPAQSDVTPDKVQLGTRLTRDIRLNIPLISAAMDTAQEYFDDHFPGCVMTAFRYDEESVREAEPEWADQYQADQAIVLLSDFQTDKHGGDGSLNPNEIYQDWQWVLVRSGNGDWTLKTCGY